MGLGGGAVDVTALVAHHERVALEDVYGSRHAVSIGAGPDSGITRWG